MKRSEAIYLRSIVEQAATSLDDKTASTAAELFPKMKGNGALVKAGTRINWGRTLKRAAVDLWDTKEKQPGQRAEFVGGYRVPRRSPNHSPGHHVTGCVRAGRVRLVGRDALQVKDHRERVHARAVPGRVGRNPGVIPPTHKEGDPIVRRW